MNKESYALYNELKDVKKTLECDACHCEFAIEGLQFHNDKVRNEKGELMEVTYFVCPNCHEVYVVLIKDNRAKSLLTCCVRVEKKLRLFEQRHKEPPKELTTQYSLTRQRFVAYQTFLKKRYAKYLHLDIKRK